MNLATQAQIRNEAVCISLSANTLEKGTNPTILLIATSLSERKLWIQTRPGEGWVIPAQNTTQVEPESLLSLLFIHTQVVDLEGMGYTWLFLLMTGASTA